MTGVRTSRWSRRTLGRSLLAGGAFCLGLALLAACGSRTSTGLGGHQGEPTGTVAVRVTVEVATASSTGTLPFRPSGSVEGWTSCSATRHGNA